jgi:Asp-tRNA(Asn)/Glu-tRNA(Gln) amidotransferase A subunit family amidase
MHIDSSNLQVVCDILGNAKYVTYHLFAYSGITPLLVGSSCLAAGSYNPSATYETVRFTLAANFTGLPAVVLPAGRQMGCNLPIG